VFGTPFNVNYLYTGVEGLFKANLLLFNNHLALSLYSGIHLRYLEDTIIMLGGPVGLSLAIRI